MHKHNNNKKGGSPCNLCIFLDKQLKNFGALLHQYKTPNEESPMNQEENLMSIEMN